MQTKNFCEAKEDKLKIPFSFVIKLVSILSFCSNQVITDIMNKLIMSDQLPYSNVTVLYCSYANLRSICYILSGHFLIDFFQTRKILLNISSKMYSQTSLRLYEKSRIRKAIKMKQSKFKHMHSTF